MLSPRVVQAIWLAAASALAAPSPGDFNGSLAILADNDLSYTPSHAAILIGGELGFFSANASCTSLGESLLSHETIQSLNNSWRYLAFKETYPVTQRFWIAQKSDNRTLCHATDSSGSLFGIQCSQKLPVLCTQGAPYPNRTFEDRSERYHISQRVGEQQITGFRDRVSFRFEGVRYAPQPRRFDFSTIFEKPGNQSALEYGTACVQAKTGSEDCLFLNVYTSSLPKPGDKKELKPVMLWIHGGGFMIGSTRDPESDPANLASRGDVVVVQINYRLGTLGFLALQNNITHGNFGIQDMVLGLQWVQKYISAFNGDPNRVTIFGQSGGAVAIRALLASPKAAGLFHGAILQSPAGGLNPAHRYLDYRSASEAAMDVGETILKETGCSNATNQLACLRSIDAVVFTNITNLNYPLNDGNYLVTSTLSPNGSDKYTARVPILVGYMRDDGATLAPFPPPDNTTQALMEVAAKANVNMSDILAEGLFLSASDYGNATFKSLNATARFMTDAIFRCMSQSLAFSGAKHKVFPAVYAFEFNRTYQPPQYTNFACDPPKTPSHPHGDPSKEYLKCHAGEIFYIMGSLGRMLPFRDEADVDFARLIIDYWAAFARSGNPNLDRKFLSARGYTGTLAQIERTSEWQQVSAEQPMLRLLEWGKGERMVPFRDIPQCRAIRLPLDYYEWK